MSGPAISAKVTKVQISSSDIYEVTKASVKFKQVVTKYGSNMSAGFDKAIAGKNTATFEVEGKLDSAAINPLINTGSTAPLLGVAVTIDYSPDGTNFYIVPCVVEEFDIESDIDSSEPVTFKATLQSNGAWTVPAA